MQDLISRMLVVDPHQRITAAQALKHPWIHTPAAVLATSGLDVNLDKLRLFNAQRKFKSAINSVVSCADAQREFELSCNSV